MWIPRLRKFKNSAVLPLNPLNLNIVQNDDLNRSFPTEWVILRLFHRHIHRPVVGPPNSELFMAGNYDSTSAAGGMPINRRVLTTHWIMKQCSRSGSSRKKSMPQSQHPVSRYRNAIDLYVRIVALICYCCCCPTTILFERSFFPWKYFSTNNDPPTHLIHHRFVPPFLGAGKWKIKQH